MDISQLRPAPGAKKGRKRVGRGYGSGHGAYATRGLKGQKSRSGGKVHPRFEGGQLPLVKRLPSKRGFTNIFKKEYAVVNLGELGRRFGAGSEVTPQAMAKSGLIKSLKLPVKVLARGELTHPLSIKAQAFSASARARVEAAGGTVEVI